MLSSPNIRGLVGAGVVKKAEGERVTISGPWAELYGDGCYVSCSQKSPVTATAERCAL